MKKFDVHLYYNGHIMVSVTAEDRNKALELAESEVDKMSDERFVSEGEFLSTGHDIYEK